MITQIVHQAQDVQQRLKTTVLIEIYLNGVAVLHHRKERDELAILVLIPYGANKGNETNATINQSQKYYFQKIQRCYNYKVIPSMSELVALNLI